MNIDKYTTHETGELIIDFLESLFNSEAYENMPDYANTEKIGNNILTEAKAAFNAGNYLDVEDSAIDLARIHEQRGFMRGYFMTLMLGEH